MIKQKYSLQEAFERRLLEDGECVDIRLLYKPFKTILIKNYFYGFEGLSLPEYFSERNLKGDVHRNKDGEIYVILGKENDNIARAELVASKLLSDDMYNLRATCSKSSNRNYIRFSIVMGPDVTVKFEGDDETPILELPPHVAYTC